jgi:hypothetical protein
MAPSAPGVHACKCARTLGAAPIGPLSDISGPADSEPFACGADQAVLVGEDDYLHTVTQSEL